MCDMGPFIQYLYVCYEAPQHCIIIKDPWVYNVCVVCIRPFSPIYPCLTVRREKLWSDPSLLGPVVGSFKPQCLIWAHSRAQKSLSVLESAPLWLCPFITGVKRWACLRIFVYINFPWASQQRKIPVCCSSESGQECSGDIKRASEFKFLFQLCLLLDFFLSLRKRRMLHGVHS